VVDRKSRFLVGLGLIDCGVSRAVDYYIKSLTGCDCGRGIGDIEILARKPDSRGFSKDT